jgi:hypothetical protein
MTSDDSQGLPSWTVAVIAIVVGALTLSVVAGAVVFYRMYTRLDDRSSPPKEMPVVAHQEESRMVVCFNGCCCKCGNNVGEASAALSDICMFVRLRRFDKSHTKITLS